MIVAEGGYKSGSRVQVSARGNVYDGSSGVVRWLEKDSGLYAVEMDNSKPWLVGFFGSELIELGDDDGRA